MTRHWAPLAGPQRAITHLRARRDGRARSAVDLEIPLMALLAVLVGIGVVVWLNGQGGPGSGEVRRVTERPVLNSPREVIAANRAERLAIARAKARVRRARAARKVAQRRAALAAAAPRRPYTGEPQSQYGYGTYGGYGPNGYPTNGYPTNGVPGQSTTQTYTQQQVQPAPAPKPAPKPQPKRSGGGGGSGGQFDDSG